MISVRVQAQRKGVPFLCTPTPPTPLPRGEGQGEGAPFPPPSFPCPRPRGRESRLDARRRGHDALLRRGRQHRSPAHTRRCFASVSAPLHSDNFPAAPSAAAVARPEPAVFGATTCTLPSGWSGAVFVSSQARAPRRSDRDRRFRPDEVRRSPSWDLQHPGRLWRLHHSGQMECGDQRARRSSSRRCTSARLRLAMPA
jgi:hypothetical protein